MDEWVFDGFEMDGDRLIRAYKKQGTVLKLFAKPDDAGIWKSASNEKYRIVGDGWGQPIRLN